MSSEPDIPEAGREYVKLILGYGVTLAVVGLAPFLGAKHVPGFVPIGELFPANMHKGLIAFATFLMEVPIITVHFFAGDRKRVPLNWIFAGFLPLLVVLPFVLYYFFSMYVVQVDFEGGNGSAAYVVGSKMEPDCPCIAHHMKIGNCIGPVLSANPAEVTACYDEAEINGRRVTLAILYLLLMLSLGAAFALAVLKKLKKRPRAPKRAPVPA